jgi:hypothetical protein
MAALIDDDLMIVEFGGRVIATARYSPHAAESVNLNEAPSGGSY